MGGGRGGRWALLVFRCLVGCSALVLFPVPTCGDSLRDSSCVDVAVVRGNKIDD